MRRANNKKKWKKGTETYDIASDMKDRISKELRLLGYEDNMNCLTTNIDITINIEECVKSSGGEQ